ncbi:hypothetical protein I317_03814 [Kwoniella heveanensis CBS 569]|nr:hypothetical protein I317_03814 [Kwoniella heveanensis CBS 569]
MPAMAVNSFMGCYSTLPTGASAVSPDDLPIGVALPSTSSGCASVCLEYYAVHYSLWQASSTQCYCSGDSPRALDSNYDRNIDAGNTDGCTASSDYHAYMLETSMALVGQYASVTLGDDQEKPGLYPTFQECFASCVDSTQAVVMYNQPYGNFFCYCTPIAAAGAASSSSASFFVYSHPAGAYGSAASTFVRRQLRERMAIARNRALLAVCPNELTACRVSSDDDTSFECIDTQSELESCGGCVYGEYNNATAILGTDCGTSTGTSLGGATCLKGKCVSFACKAGYVLVDGQCVA